MNLLDIVLLLLVALALLSGWQKGFITGAIELIVMAGSIGAAFYCYPFVAVILSKYFHFSGAWNLPASFLISFVLSRIALGLISNYARESVPPQFHQQPANKWLGLLPGFLKGLGYAILLVALLLAAPLYDQLSARNSRVAEKLSAPAEWIDGRMFPVVQQAAMETMKKYIVEPGPNESVPLPFTVREPEVRSDLEASMLVLVNEERVLAGLKPLQADPEMTMVARSHSRDMFARGYFAHNTPEGRDPFDRMRAGGVRFISAGENLALSQNLRIAHSGLMHSPGHRANILNTSFGRVGIGILDGGIYGLMVTQDFRN